jgi:hypothetical protein
MVYDEHTVRGEKPSGVAALPSARSYGLPPSSSACRQRPPEEERRGGGGEDQWRRGGAGRRGTHSDDLWKECGACDKNVPLSSEAELGQGAGPGRTRRLDTTW